MELEFPSSNIIAYISLDAYSVFLYISSKKLCKKGRIVIRQLIIAFLSFVFNVSTPVSCV